jgi:hypothetical protein
MWVSQVLWTQQKGQKTRGWGSVDPRNHTEHLLSKAPRTTFGALACWCCASAKIGMTLVHYSRVFQLLHVRKTACAAGNESWHSSCLQLAPHLYTPTKTRKFLNFYGIAAKKLPLRASFILIFSTKSSDFEHTEHICSPIMRVSMVLNDVFLSPCYLRFSIFNIRLFRPLSSSLLLKWGSNNVCRVTTTTIASVVWRHSHLVPPRTTDFLLLGTALHHRELGRAGVVEGPRFSSGCTASWFLGCYWEGLLALIAVIFLLEFASYSLLPHAGNCARALLNSTHFISFAIVSALAIMIWRTIQWYRFMPWRSINH